MSETLVLALVTGATGLGGAVIGVLGTLAVEDRNRRRQRLGISNGIRMDLIRWAEACRTLADDWRLRAHPGQGLNWATIAPIATVHLPPGLSLMLFIQYMEREQTEAAYSTVAEFASNMPDPLPPQVPADLLERVFRSRYSLRRWAVGSDAVLAEWDRYSNRSWFERTRSRLGQPDRLDRSGKEAESEARMLMIQRANELLADEYPYSTGDQGELLPPSDSVAAYTQMLADFVRAYEGHA